MTVLPSRGCQLRNCDEAPLIRKIPRRLKQLETRANEVAAARPEPHTLCFIEPINKRV